MQADVDEALLDSAPDAVPRARGFATDVLSAWGADDLVADGELVVTELVTNAVLHAGGPVRLRMLPLLGGVRIEVADGSRRPPLLVPPNPEAMTGRGLRLVAGLSRRWGVEPGPDGKVVWCELMRSRGGDDGAAAPAGDLATERLDDADSGPAGVWDQEHAAERFTVRIGDVPTDLLLAAKAHVDNLVREFTLATHGAASGHSAAVPAHLARLVETVLHGFAEARDSVKRQALAASARGEPRTTLVLRLPASAAVAGEEYIAALDQADGYARAARLLTLESPPQHRVFRHWYVGTVIEQLRHAAAGEPAPPPKTLEQWALDELDHLAAAQRATDRAARLQTVTAALAATATVEDVAAVVVSQGVSALAASGGALLRRDDERLTVPASLGYPEQVLRELQTERLAADLPAAHAIRTAEPVWLESAKERDARFPQVAGREPGTVALCAVPVQLGKRVLGALRFSFEAPQLFDEDVQRFTLALAAQTAQALDRCAMVEAERGARADAELLASTLIQLQQVTAQLGAARTVEEVAEIVVTRAADALGAGLTTVSVLEDETTLRVLRMRGAAEATMRRWTTYPVAADLPGSEAVRERRPVVVHGIAELEARFPTLAGQASEDRPLVCMPLTVGETSLGVVTLSFPPGTDVDDPGKQRFLSTLADACAQAIQRAEALDRAQAAGTKLAFLVEASAALASSLDYRDTLKNVARLVVPRLADWCAVHVVESDECRTLAVAHVDPAKVAQAQELQQRYPIDLDAPTGVPNVIRTGVPELYLHVTDDMLVAGAQDEEHLRDIRALGLSSVLIVPMTGQTGTFGAITLVFAESGRHYEADDQALVTDLARRAAVAVEHANAYSRQTGRLAAITRVAEAAQHAILAPVPAQVGPLRLEAAYVSAAADALVGGDLYEVVTRRAATRLLIADVRGKGLEAVRTATVVLGEFRSAAVGRGDLTAVAEQMDHRLRPYLREEDFVTALIAEIRDDGACDVASCGHPPALLASAGQVREVGEVGGLPLGLGASPTLVTVTLDPGDRLLLHTDGLLEARDAERRFVDVSEVSAPLLDAALGSVLDGILARLRRLVGPDLDDDLALLVAEYRPG